MAKRKVHFYRAHAGLDAAGELRPVDLSPALRHIAGLAFDANGRYLDDEDNALCAWPAAGLPFPSMGLGMIRRSDLPEVERGGALEPLVIPENSGIVEQTHFVFFPHNIVGCLFNFYGPRVSKLRSYLRRKFPGTPVNLRFDPLLRQDILEQLDRMTQIRVLQLRVRRSFADRIAEANQGLGQAFQASLAASDAEEVELILRPRPRRHSWLSRAITGTVRTLARDPELQEDVGKFNIQGQSPEGNLEWVDVLKDRFIVEQEVETTRGRRAVTPDSAYRAIEGAYAELEGQLIRAAQVW